MVCCFSKGFSNPYYSLFRKLYKWSLKLDPESSLKTGVDHVLCSLCYCKPWLYVYLLTRMQVLKVSELVEKDETPIEELAFRSYEEDNIFGRFQLESLATLTTTLNVSKLMTLGRVSASPVVARYLLSSGLLNLLNQSILSFCEHLNGGIDTQNSQIINTQFLTSILRFYEQLCAVNPLKSWFGSEGSTFWLPILRILSSLSFPVKSALLGGTKEVHQLECAVIQFLAKCCWSYPDNQKILAACLRDIILGQTAPVNTRQSNVFHIHIRRQIILTIFFFHFRYRISPLNVFLFPSTDYPAAVGKRKGDSSCERRLQNSAEDSCKSIDAEGQTSVYGS